MKTVNYFLYVALLVLASTFLAGCGKQTIDGAALPEFYGLFAIDGGKLIQIKQGEVPNFGENVSFLLFDKNVAAAEDVAIYSIGFDTEPHPADDGSFSWQKFAQQGEAYQRASQAAMTGIPEGAVPLETLKKPVPKQNEMLQYVPATPLKPGFYQFGNAVKFWVNKEKYQTTVESNARQELQTGHWVDASRFATIALIVGTSSPNLVDEMTQIKYGALSKGANEALKQGNFDLAENLAKRGNDLQPPSQFASELSQLLNIEIPYQKAMKAATDASQQEDWDLLTRACKFALNLKPNDAKAVELLSKSPKILLAGFHDIRFDQSSAPQSVETLYLKFTADGGKLFAGVGDHNTIGSIPHFRYELIWDVAGSQFLKPIEYSIDANSMEFSAQGKIIAMPAARGIFFRDLESNRDTDLFNAGDTIYINHFGFSGDGSICYANLASLRQGDLSRWGLWPAAEQIGVSKNGGISGYFSGTIFWNTERSSPIMIAGFPDNQQIQNVLISSDNRVAVICEIGYRGPSAQNRNTYPDRLSVWDFATQKLLVRFNSNPQDMLILCAVRPDESSAVVYEGELQIGDFGAFETAGKGPDGTLIIHSKPGKFKFLNWSSFKDTHDVNVPSDASLIAFSPNSKYIAYASQNDPLIRIAEIDSLKIVCSFKEASGVKVSNLAFSPDGAYLAVALDRNRDSLALWKIPNNLKSLIAERPASSNIQHYSSLVSNPPDNNSVIVPAALQETLNKAEAGDAQAQLDLGLAYATGKGMVTNYIEATKWFRKAADQGNAKAERDIGIQYQYGRGVETNLLEAFKWFQKSADQNDAAAQVNLGLAYENGRGVGKDYAKALEWFRKAADQGNAPAQYNLGLIYKNGWGVNKDMQRQ